MRIALIFLFILTGRLLTCAQSGNWEVYLARYDDGPGSTILNMDLIRSAPKKELPYLLITGVTYTACDKDGFPYKKEFDKLYEISDQVIETMAGITKYEHAGSFTHGCERLDYLYLHDTLGIRKKLENLYTEKFKPYKYQIGITADTAWDAYLRFLYPNEETLEFMNNSKVLDRLSAAGDKLIKARPIDHWLYFSTLKDRDAFIRYAEQEKFIVVSKEYLKESEQPYQLKISRTDPVDPESLLKLTLGLRKKAKELKGQYDGWESVVLKD
ncbi:MAG: DUF695 domain-containing protein [Cytophagaceae bacterium]